ncbi:cyclic nucleotide-binding domain-containing protein [Magnetovibrio sp. PR-2]|uniref:cyclic nucleotide-binding domain-containing protein n=1 Tax=Magnetovibrio sp. PR-2 TaxID=3120356 RepID=UPI002FCDF62D
MSLAEGIAWGDLMGIVGVILYIGSYFALQAGIIKGQGYLYATLNTAAASCVLLSLVNNFNLSSAIIQVTYIAISVFGIIRFYILTHRIKFNFEELAFIGVASPNLDKLYSRKLLNVGMWKTVPPDTVLTAEGQTPSSLFYIFEGYAEVTVGGKSVAHLEGNSLVGEMSCLTGMPASATVIATKPTRIFELNLGDLEKFLVRNPTVRHELESRFAKQISTKLVRANAALMEQV